MPQRLDADERHFFSLVGRAVLTNPFSAAREDLDRQIAGRYPHSRGDNHVDEAVQEVGSRIRRLAERKKADITAFGQPDRKLLKHAFLFDAFHRFIPQFDTLITDQAAAGERSLPVRFAAEFAATLERLGFTHPDAIRYFELCFQLRRAFYFIQKHLVGCSACMRGLRESLWNNVFTHNIDWYDRFLWNRMEDFSTLILGPTGAGKGTAAAAIGRSGYIPFDEKKNCFVISFTQSLLAMNLSQFSPTLIESELFGHKKGAFTGAVEDYKGIFDRCSPFGAIFLDEIGEVSQSIQIKLLQVIQERTFAPVGGHKTSRFSGRLIAASNRPLEQLRSKEFLRDDFYYRLCSDVIVLPSLAQRIREDPLELDDLLAHTVARILGKTSPELTTMLRAIILKRPGRDYHWPGNVRELEQCVRRIMLNQAYEPEMPSGTVGLSDHLAQGVKEGLLGGQTLLSGYCYNLYRQLGTYEAVARRAQLDRRTVKKYVQEGAQLFENNIADK